MGKIIFRRFGGRIVPIPVTPGFTPHKVIQESSAKLRDVIKAKVAARTSLEAKRVASVGSVRRMVADSNWPQVGKGAYAITLADPKRPGWAVKRGAGSVSAHLADRVVTKAVLSKHGLAPETFHVQTKEHDYLVQKLGKVRQDQPNFTDRAGWSGIARSRIKLHNSIDRIGIDPEDMSGQNMAKFKGRTKSIDSGSFDFRRSLSDHDRARISKFKISGRDYLEPIDQKKFFKGKK